MFIFVEIVFSFVGILKHANARKMSHGVKLFNLILILDQFGKW
jgi:hypothetical protein